MTYDQDFLNIFANFIMMKIFWGLNKRCLQLVAELHTFDKAEKYLKHTLIIIFYLFGGWSTEVFSQVAIKFTSLLARSRLKFILLVFILQLHGCHAIPSVHFKLLFDLYSAYSWNCSDFSCWSTAKAKLCSPKWGFEFITEYNLFYTYTNLY